MFDIGFSELVIVGVVALVVIGPERLPRVARTAGHLFGRLQRYVSQVKTDISREMELAELGKVKTEFEGAARDFQSEMESKAAEAERGMRDIEAALDERPAGEPAAGASPPADAAAPPPQLELGLGEPPNEEKPAPGP